MTANGSNNKWIGKRTPRPDGADKMSELRNQIRYRYSEIESGARVRITSRDGSALEAISHPVSSGMLSDSSSR